MRPRTLVLAGFVTILTTASALAGVDPQAACEQFLRTHPDAGFLEDGRRITRAFGPALARGNCPADSAAAFVRDHVAMFGVNPTDLVPGDPLDHRTSQPVMSDPAAGDYRFTLIYYSQSKDGVPVCGANLRLLIRNGPGFPLVLAASNLRNLGNFTVPHDAAAVDPGDHGRAAASARVPDLVNFTPPRYVIWAGAGNASSPPALAVTFIADNGRPATADFAKWRFVADAATGGILHAENLIVPIDVVGNVSAMATPGIPPKADWCNPLDTIAMPAARVSIGDTFVYTDQTGNFTIPHEGSEPVVVVSPVRGRWFRVYNHVGADSVLQMVVTPPGPAEFLHNDPDGEFTRAEVNAYIQANAARGFVLLWNELYPTIHSEEQFPVNVNMEYKCYAYYDYSSINLGRAGPMCANAAFSGVVHHEYGHHVIACGGSGQGQYGEGMADSIAVLIADDPGIGYGFITAWDCDTPLRSAENEAQYPESCLNGDAFQCGQVLSGSIWDTRNELAVTHPVNALQIISNLTVNSILLHSGDTIDPAITVDFLTLDDDDGDIGNGTPHYDEICAGFGAHGLDCPDLTSGLRVTPDEDFHAAGPVGGPFHPGSSDYTVENLGDDPIDYEVTAAEPWLSITNATGSLPPHGSTIVTITIDADAGALDEGTHTGTVHFINATDHVGDTTRQVVLVIGLPGDLNCDGGADGADVDPFVLALLSPDGYADRYPDCERSLADCNGDGYVDCLDIDAFTQILIAP